MYPHMQLVPPVVNPFEVLIVMALWGFLFWILHEDICSPHSKNSKAFWAVFFIGLFLQLVALGASWAALLAYTRSTLP